MTQFSEKVDFTEHSRGGQRVELSVNDKPWRRYGLDEPAILDYVRKYSQASMFVSTLEISNDGSVGKEHILTTSDALLDFTTGHPERSDLGLRILTIKELSAEALQILSVAYGIHFGFWAWVTSDQAVDGFWLNTHNDGKILSFDLPCFEFYGRTKPSRARIVREGRMKHLASRHRILTFREDNTFDDQGHDTYISRRVTAFLSPPNETRAVNTLLFFSEDCRAVSSSPLPHVQDSDPVSTEWFLRELRGTDGALRALYVKEPVGLILSIVMKLLKTWHVFTVAIQRDLENIDSNLPEGLPAELPEHNLYDVGTYLHRDIVQTMFRFAHQLGKYEGYLKYLCNGTTDQFRPKVFAHDVANLMNNVADLKRRMEISKERANMSLTLINNFIALQQARLANEQAMISADMAQVQRRDAQSSVRLSVVATIFLPLSFATSWLSTNDNPTPKWVFVPVAVGSILLTIVVILSLKWMEEREISTDVLVARIMGRPPPMGDPMEIRTRPLRKYRRGYSSAV